MSRKLVSQVAEMTFQTRREEVIRCIDIFVGIDKRNLYVQVMCSEELGNLACARLKRSGSCRSPSTYKYISSFWQYCEMHMKAWPRSGWMQDEEKSPRKKSKSFIAMSRKPESIDQTRITWFQNHKSNQMWMKMQKIKWRNGVRSDLAWTKGRFNDNVAVAG